MLIEQLLEDLPQPIMPSTQETPNQTADQPEATTEHNEAPTETEEVWEQKGREDDDDRVFQFFEPTIGFELDDSLGSNLFLCEDHKLAIQSFLTCGPIPHHFVDFDCRDS